MEPRCAARRIRPVDRRLHADDHEPEPARHPPAHGRVRAASARAQAARGGARCRRRLRQQDLPLRRGGDRDVGGREARAADQVDVGSLRGVHVGRARPRPRQHRRDGARRGRQLPRAAGQDAVQHGRVSLDLRAGGADLSLRDAARGRVQDAGDLRRGEGGVHQHRAGRRLSRRRPAGGDVPAGASRRHHLPRHRA